MLVQIAWMFMTYSLIGWVWETTYVSILRKKVINRGFLRGPFIPLYGFAATTMLLTMDWMSKRFDFGAFHHSVLAILCAAVIASLWEYVTSFLMETAFSARWWDYSHLKFNLNGRIALLPSAFWGIGGFVLWRYVEPAIRNGYFRLSPQDNSLILTVLYSLLALDAVVTLAELIQFRQVLTRLHTLSKGIFEIMADRIKRIEGALEQQETLVQLLHEAHKEIRLKANYVPLERRNEFGEFTSLIRARAKSVLHGQEHRLAEFTEVLSKIRKYERFYKGFPNALTNKLPYVHVVIRYKKKSS